MKYAMWKLQRFDRPFCDDFFPQAPQLLKVDVELFFELHDQFNDIQRIDTQRRKIHFNNVVRDLVDGYA